jgi:hypothetical protein
MTAAAMPAGAAPERTPVGRTVRRLQVRIVKAVMKLRSAVNLDNPKWELDLEARLGWLLTQTRTGRSRMSVDSCARRTNRSGRVPQRAFVKA